MAAPIYSIRTTGSDVRVYYNISIGVKNRLTGKTNVTVDSRYWDDGKRVVNDKIKKVSDACIDLNKAVALGFKTRAIKEDANLDNLKKFAKNKLKELKESHNKGDIRSALKSAIDIELGWKSKPGSNKTPKFYEFFSQNEDLLKLDEVSSNTITAYGRLKDLIIEYEKKNNLPEIGYEDINIDFYIKFRKFLDSKQLGLNYQGAVIQRLKSIMGRSYHLGYHKNLQYKTFKNPNEKVFSIYLKEDELDALYYLEALSERDTAIRDYFLLMCWTGARVNDALKWTYDDNIKVIGDKLKIVYVQAKTDEPHSIEVTPKIQEILDRYDGFPNEKPWINIYDRLINDKIKQIARLADIDTMIKGKPKYQWIYTHTGRRTAATLARLAGKPWWEVQAITGHQSISMVKAYCKANNEETIEALKEVAEKKMKEDERLF